LNKKVLILAGLILLIITGSLVYLKQQSKPVSKVLLGMTYIPNVQFAPWYVAKEKGFFAAEGLEVEFDYRMDIDALQLVATGQMDFAIAGGDQVITARSREIPVVYLMSLYAKFPPTIIAKAESNIKSVEDLKGKKVGLPLYGTNLLAIQAILHQAGVSQQEVQLVDIGYTQIASLIADKVDAVVGFANNEPVKLRLEGHQITELPSWDYFSLVGHGLITGEKQLTQSKDQVAKMVRATLKGMQYALDHPDETFAICLKYLPEVSAEQKVTEREVLAESMKLWENEVTKAHGLGYSDLQSWQASQQLMFELGLIEKVTPVEKFVSFEFLPKR